eukprot:m.16488 g.16488  ORF g.16488 m.16488 type:complete len:414 (-) comp5264_c0_seq1:273-1514(-)
MAIRGGDHVRLMLVTINCGSMFEDGTGKMMAHWLDVLDKAVAQHSPTFVALHHQEVGGKRVDGADVQGLVTSYRKSLCRAFEGRGFDLSVSSYDVEGQDYSSDNGHTALGSSYFVHSGIADRAKPWNVADERFVTLAKKQRGGPECFEKTKFTIGQYGVNRASRKGCLVARWKLGTRDVVFTNVHLFHDASNVAAAQQSPSPYALCRREALETVLERSLHWSQAAGSEPNGVLPDKHRGKRARTQESRLARQAGAQAAFLFGDFNFRLDLAEALGHLTDSCRPRRTKDQQWLEYCVPGSLEPFLTVRPKRFTIAQPQLFSDPEVLAFDKEPKAFEDTLCECDVGFGPTYAFSEDVDKPNDYLDKRCPAWCDRVLFTPAANQLLDASQTEYFRLADDYCVGDHKPVALVASLDT